MEIGTLLEAKKATQVVPMLATGEKSCDAIPFASFLHSIYELPRYLQCSWSIEESQYKIDTEVAASVGLFKGGEEGDDPDFLLYDNNLTCSKVCSTFFAKWLLTSVISREQEIITSTDDEGDFSTSNIPLSDESVCIVNGLLANEESWLNNQGKSSSEFYLRNRPRNLFLKEIDVFSSEYATLTDVILKASGSFLKLDWFACFCLLLILIGLVVIFLRFKVFRRCRLLASSKYAYPLDYSHHQVRCHHFARDWHWQRLLPWQWQRKSEILGHHSTTNRTGVENQYRCCRCLCRSSIFCCCWLLVVVMALPPNRTELLCGSLQNFLDASLSLLCFWRKVNHGDLVKVEAGGKKRATRTSRKNDDAATSMKTSEERERPCCLSSYCQTLPGSSSESHQPACSHTISSGELTVVSTAEELETGLTIKHKDCQSDSSVSPSTRRHQSHQSRFRKSLAFLRSFFSRGWKWASGSTGSRSNVTIPEPVDSGTANQEIDRYFGKTQCPFHQCPHSQSAANVAARSVVENGATTESRQCLTTYCNVNRPSTSSVSCFSFGGSGASQVQHDKNVQEHYKVWIKPYYI